MRRKRQIFGLVLDVQKGSCDKTQQGLTYLTGNVRIASSYSPATSDKDWPGAMAGSVGAAIGSTLVARSAGIVFIRRVSTMGLSSLRKVES